MSYKIQYGVNKEELKEILKIDEKTYKNGDYCPYDICVTWCEKNNEIYTVLKSNNKIIGYISFLPLTRECYNEYLKATLCDGDIRPEDILVYEDNKTYNCLFCSIAIEKSYRNTRNFQRLYLGFLAKIRELRERNIKIERVIADVVNPKIDEMLKNNKNFTYICKHEAGNIYEGICEGLWK